LLALRARVPLLALRACVPLLALRACVGAAGWRLMGSMWYSRLFWRLFLSFAVFGLALIGFPGAVLLQQARQRDADHWEGAARARALLLRDAVRGQSAEQARQLQQRLRDGRGAAGARVTFLDRDGRPLADDADDDLADRPELRAARETGFGSARRRLANAPDEWCVAVPTDDSAGPVAYVHLALAGPVFGDGLAGSSRLLWTALLVAGLASLFLALRLAGHIAGPVRELTRAAESLVAGGHGRKVYVAGRDEIARLARTFNTMSEHLAEQVAQLDEDRQQLRTILSGMVEGVVALDAQERILFANGRAAELLEFDAQAVVGRKFWEVVRQRPLQEVLRKAWAGSGTARQELNWNGSPARCLAVHVACLPGPQWGRTRGAVLVLHDTTDLRRLERHRQEFVANVSHELKTPLSVIKVCTETLLGGALDDVENRGSFLERIDRQTDRLQALILDLLSLARIEAGTEAFDFEAVAVGPVVAACLDRHRDRAETRHQVLEAVPPPPGEDPTVWADQEAVGQILDNLVDNALKYSPPGSRVWVRWRVDGHHVRLEVEDNGTGIPEHDLPRIFERFYRVDKARSRELGGTGLGLSIVKHLVQAMRGSVRAASRLGHGTTFTVRLPRRPVS
jgi:two-component system phosphate regulon sensor histidine kinase PhoR